VSRIAEMPVGQRGCILSVVFYHALESQSKGREQVGQEAVSQLLIWKKSLAVSITWEEHLIALQVCNAGL